MFRTKLISPARSTNRPEPAPGFSVARATIASVPSVTVWVPLLPFRSVAVKPGSAALMRTSVNALAYWVVSMVSAAFDAA